MRSPVATARRLQTCLPSGDNREKRPHVRHFDDIRPDGPPPIAAPPKPATAPSSTGARRLSRARRSAYPDSHLTHSSLPAILARSTGRLPPESARSTTERSSAASRASRHATCPPAAAHAKAERPDLSTRLESAPAASSSPTAPARPARAASINPSSPEASIVETPAPSSAPQAGPLRPAPRPASPPHPHATTPPTLIIAQSAHPRPRTGPPAPPRRRCRAGS